MRIRIIAITVALLLASASLTWAQGTAQIPTTQPSQTRIPASSLGFVDFGYRGTSASGDVARYERYRDDRDGVYTAFGYARQTDTIVASASVSNAGYRDQFYNAEYNNGRLRAFGLWNSIPTNYSYLTSTPWTTSITGSTVNFALDDAAQLSVQNKVPGVVGVPSSVAQLATPSIYRGLAQPFDMQSKRDIAGGGVSYDVNSSLNVNMNFTTTKKSGNMPVAASFAFNNANELAVPIDNRTNDATVAAEWSFTDGLLRVAWDGSWFNNAYHDIVWDNPLRLTDFNNGLNPPSGPFDPSAYSNGNGPAMGRMALAPDNSMNVISAMGLYRRPAHSTLNAHVSFTNMRQNDSLIPWTINPVINQQVVWNFYPGLAQLPRGTAQAEVNGLNALFNFSSRPNRIFAFAMRYRYNNHDNTTPVFEAHDYVRLDGAASNAGHETEQFDVRRRTLDANAIFHVLPSTAVKVGYGFDSFNRTGRSFSDMTDDAFRLSVDTTQWQWLMIRGSYEHIVRVGSGFSESSLEDGGQQPGIRFYDESDRIRDRGTILLTFTPFGNFDVSFQYAAGKDVYSGEGHEFGLMDTNNDAINIGANYLIRDNMSFGVNYGRDIYKAFQQARNANPDCSINTPPCAYNSWADPNRDWNLQNDERVNNFGLYFDMLGALKNTDVRIAYDFSDSDNSFLHGGPRVQALSTNTILTPGDSAPCSGGVPSCFIAMPNVTNQWQRLSADVRHYFTSKIGVGFGWYFEKLDVSDWATVDTNGPVGFNTPTGTPRIDWLGGINTGYGVRPYEGNTLTVRLLYKF